MIILPITGTDPASRVQVALDGVDYLFRAIYADRPAPTEADPDAVTTRAGVWRLDLFLVDGTPLAIGEPVRPGRPVFLNTVTAAAPAGLFYAWDLGNDSDRSLGLDDLGSTVQIVYFSPDEVPPEETDDPLTVVTP